MKTFIALLVAVALAIGGIFVYQNWEKWFSRGDATIEPSSYSALSDAANDFSFKLSKELLKEAGRDKGNFLVSPLSVWLPLAALVNGTSEKSGRELLLSSLCAKGFTLEQINSSAKALIASLTQKNPDSKIKDPLQIANALFVSDKYDLNSSFEEAFSTYFDGTAETVDFTKKSSANRVNAWANQKTNGMIPYIIDEFDPETVTAIANAIYFADEWSDEFEEGSTRPAQFHGTRAETTAQFMTHGSSLYSYYEDSDLQALPLAYKSGARLLLLLPKKKTAVETLSSLTGTSFQKILHGLESTSGRLYFPRFTFDDTFDLKTSLKALGIPFCPDTKLTFPNIVEQSPLVLDQAIQKTRIEVEEKGTKAAAVTVITTTVGSAANTKPEKFFVMDCNKPFAFVLYGANGQILFTGVVNQTGE